MNGGPFSVYLSMANGVLDVWEKSLADTKSIPLIAASAPTLAIARAWLELVETAQYASPFSNSAQVAGLPRAWMSVIKGPVHTYGVFWKVTDHG